MQLARPEGAGWSLRVPLTTAPQFVRGDESGSRYAAGQPLAVLRDPGHPFSLDLTFADADSVASKTHALAAVDERVQLRDRVITWRPRTDEQPARCRGRG